MTRFTHHYAEQRLHEEIDRLKRKFSASNPPWRNRVVPKHPNLFVVSAVSRDEEMNEDNLANTLDRILAERLHEVPLQYPANLLEAIHWVIRWVRHRSGARPGVRPDSPRQTETIARIRSLPVHLQEPLRRYFVFREAEESICLSLDTTPAEFRRFLREAAGYILKRQERLPQLETKPWRDRGRR